MTLWNGLKRTPLKKGNKPLKKGNSILKKKPLKPISKKQAKRLAKQRKETEKLINQHEGICPECGRFNTIYNQLGQDHIIPRGKGGSDNPENKELKCSYCHIVIKHKNVINYNKEKNETN